MCDLIFMIDNPENIRWCLSVHVGTQSMNCLQNACKNNVPNSHTVQPHAIVRFTTKHTTIKITYMCTDVDCTFWASCTSWGYAPTAQVPSILSYALGILNLLLLLPCHHSWKIKVMSHQLVSIPMPCSVSLTPPVPESTAPSSTQPTKPKVIKHFASKQQSRNPNDLVST